MAEGQYHERALEVIAVSEVQGVKPQLICYLMSMLRLAAAGRIFAGFALLARAQVKGMLLPSDSV